MAAMKPRTGDGPMEVAKEGRGIVMRVPVDGGGRLVVEMNATEATDLLNALRGVVGFVAESALMMGSPGSVLPGDPRGQRDPWKAMAFS